MLKGLWLIDYIYSLKVRVYIYLHPGVCLTKFVKSISVLSKGKKNKTS